MVTDEPEPFSAGHVSDSANELTSYLASPSGGKYATARNFGITERTWGLIDTFASNSAKKSGIAGYAHAEPITPPRDFFHGG